MMKLCAVDSSRGAALPAGDEGGGAVLFGRRGPQHTPDLLDEAGYRYVLDWCMDDQPVWLKTRSGRILAVPYPQELNDSAAIIGRHVSAAEFADMIIDQFDEMLEQSREQPLVMGIALHAMIVGQPFRLRQSAPRLRAPGAAPRGRCGSRPPARSRSTSKRRSRALLPRGGAPVSAGRLLTRPPGLRQCPLPAQGSTA